MFFSRTNEQKISHLFFPFRIFFPGLKFPRGHFFLYEKHEDRKGTTDKEDFCKGTISESIYALKSNHRKCLIIECQRKQGCQDKGGSLGEGETLFICFSINNLK